MKRVLIIDDDPNLRDLLALLVRAELPEAEIGQAADGQEGLLLAQELHPDLIILDGQMPVQDGAAICRQLRESIDSHPMRVLGITAFSQGSELVWEMQRSCDHLLFKPFSYDALLGAIRTLRGSA